MVFNERLLFGFKCIFLLLSFYIPLVSSILMLILYTVIFFFKRLAKPADKREWKDTQPFLFLSPSWLGLAYQPISLHGNKSALQGAAASGQCCGWAGASGQNGPLGL